MRFGPAGAGGPHMYALLFYSIGIPNRTSRITALHANIFTTLTPH